MPLDQDAALGNAAILTLELIAYRAGDKTSERLILRDAQGTHQQVIYDARTLDQGNLVDAFAVLVQRLRRHVMTQGQGTPDDAKGNEQG